MLANQVVRDFQPFADTKGDFVAGEGIPVKVFGEFLVSIPNP